MGSLYRRFYCWLRGRLTYGVGHKANHRTTLSPGGPPWWECWCGRRMSLHHPETGQVARLTDDYPGWEMVDPEEARR